MTPQEQYIEEQKNSGLKIGDRVTVTRIAQDYEQGWVAIWAPKMNKAIGESGTITGFSTLRPNNGIGIQFDKILGCNTFWFPWFVLQKENVASMSRGYSPQTHLNPIPKFKVGDKVKVMRKPVDKAEDPARLWISGMEKCIGKTMKVTGVHGSDSVLKLDKGYCFPVAICKLVDNLVDGDMETAGTCNWKTIDKPVISNYPHKCPHCGSASYNDTFFNKVDCSNKGCSK